MKKIQHLKEVTGNLEHYNKMSPFPIYDTEYVQKLKEQLESMVDENHDYDSDPVHACKYCKNLNVQYDDNQNEICMRCGSKNSTIEFKDIHEYLKFKKTEE